MAKKLFLVVFVLALVLVAEVSAQEQQTAADQVSQAAEYAEGKTADFAKAAMDQTKETSVSWTEWAKKKFEEALNSDEQAAGAETKN